MSRRPASFRLGLHLATPLVDFVRLLIFVGACAHVNVGAQEQGNVTPSLDGGDAFASFARASDDCWEDPTSTAVE